MCAETNTDQNKRLSVNYYYFFLVGGKKAFEETCPFGDDDDDTCSGKYWSSIMKSSGMGGDFERDLEDAMECVRALVITPGGSRF